jgi:tRNA (pseudouridine54-N1)-methyltransferase
MNLIFFIKSNTIKIDKYNIKNIPGSTGRLDVISRCILAALTKTDSFDEDVEIWVFLDRYGTFIFNPDFFNYDNFPKNELRFTDYFVYILQKSPNKEKHFNPLSTLKQSQMGFIEAIRHFQRLNYSLYILQEEGSDFFTILENIRRQKNMVFILGSQEDEFLTSEELLALKIPTISIGNKSYLASSVIRLLKLLINSF